VNTALGFAAFAALWWIIRAFVARREEQDFVAGYQRDASGIIVGAEPMVLTGTRPGAVLLLHGYNDSPQSMASVARAFHARGWTVHVPLLPGHGRTLQSFAQARAEDWVQASRMHLNLLQAAYGEVAVGGLSMGGAISIVLAAKNPDIRAVVVFAPYLHASMPLRLLRILAPIAALGARYLASGGGRSVHDPVASDAMIAYRRSTPRLLIELDRIVRMARAALPRVMQPVLVIQSREDNRIPLASAEEAFGRIGSPDKTLHWTTGNGHVVTVDHGHEAIEQLAADWLEARLS
jgi:carboxylesterase